MDLNTGKTYDSLEQAVREGVPAADVFPVPGGFIVSPPEKRPEEELPAGLPWPPRSKRPGEARNRKARNRVRNRMATASRRANR